MTKMIIRNRMCRNASSRSIRAWCCHLLLLSIFQTKIQCSNAFQVAFPSVPFRQTKSSTTTKIINMNSGGFGNEERAKSSSSPKKASAAGEFAYQEMRAQLNAMRKQGIPSRDLGPEKRAELEGYVRTVLNNRSDMSIPLENIGEQLLPQSKWQLLFSTQSAVLGDLPRDASVFINILDEENLDYRLQFSKKTLGLNSITAKSKYTFDSGPIQPGLLTFVYDKITTDVFGLNSIGVGFFGLLKGRANYLESKYFDGTFWIEQGLSASGEQDFINVYMRSDA